VRNFVEETDLLKGRTADQWQTDAFGQVQAWLKSPAGAYQWKAKGAPATIPDAHDKSNKHVPILAILPLRIPPELHRHWLTPL
jgi:catalase (peroxidase I)